MSEKIDNNLDNKNDMTFTQAQAEVAELERELMMLKAKREQQNQNKQNSETTAATAKEKPKFKTNAEAYYKSERNVADMLAEYDDISNDDIKDRRPVRTSKANTSRTKAPSGKSEKSKPKSSNRKVHSPKKDDSRKVAATKKEIAKKESSKKKAAVARKDSLAKTKAVARTSKYEDAMYDDVYEKKTTKKRNASFDDSSKYVRSKAKGKKKKSKNSTWDNICNWFKELSGVDYMIGATGALVLVVAIITGSIYASAKNAEAQVAAFAPLGEELSSIGIVGESALYAMANNRGEDEVLVLDLDEEDFEYTEYEEKEDESANGATVNMEMTSVVKDLKIKFVNKKNGKLIAGVPFQVEITDSAGKAISKTDDDKDGIIYIDSITPGQTKVKMVALSGYDSYEISTETKTVTVKETPDYKKIDVANEVKSEKQVNAAVEDTAQATQVESVLQDTVAWVESTKTATGSETVYTKVSPGDIEEPKEVASVGWINSLYYRFKEFTQYTWIGEARADEPSSTPEGATPTPTEEVAPTAEVTPAETPTPTPTEAASSEPTPTPTASTTPEATATPTATVTPTEAVTPTPIITPTPKYDNSAALKTKSNERLYYKDGDSYKEATVGYYIEHKSDTYYKQSSEATGYKYTGWQDIDGNTYFFDADGNKITGEQVIQGAKYNFGSDGALQKGSGNLGIDVSKWNGSIDWNKVKSSGISYVIIRCGYRGSTTGALIEDPTFKTNIKGATNAGLKVGIYFFSQAVNEVEAIEEASMTLGLIGGYKISYPVFLDVEPSKGRGDTIDAATRTKVINAYCQTIRNSGYTPGVYANKTWLQEKFSPGSINGKIWLAQYAAAPTYSGGYQMWQYTSKGKVSGISGNVDMNLSYLGY